MPEISTISTSRRNFLQWIISALSLGALAGIAHVFAHYLMPPPKMKKSSELSIPTAQIPNGSSLIVDYKGSPVIVVHVDDRFAAFSATCTHLGCIVKWAGNEKSFDCPCHGGKFDLAGKVVSGPPPEPLHSIPIEVVDNTITFT